MRQLVFVILGLLIWQCSFAQSKPAEYNLDSNKMVGDIYVIPFFCDATDSEWLIEDVMHATTKLKDSQNWLAAQAAKYDVELNFINDPLKTSEEIIVLTRFDMKNTRTMLEKCMKQMGYHNYKDYFEWNEFDLKSRKVIVLFFVKMNGRSHAYSLRNPEFNGMTILYRGQNINTHTISHEILHLFGAWDLYHRDKIGTAQSRYNSDRAKRLFPHSVMISSYGNRDKINVDELTAWRVGWNDDYKMLFSEFKPGRF